MVLISFFKIFSLCNLRLGEHTTVVIISCCVIIKNLCYRDAEDAVHARDGYDYDGYRLRVEFPRGGGPGSYRGNRSGGSSGGDRGGGRRGPPARRSQFRVLVTGNITFKFLNSYMIKFELPDLFCYST